MRKLSDIIIMIEDELNYEMEIKKDIPDIRECERRVMSMIMQKTKGCLDPNYALELIRKTYQWMFRV